MRSLVTALLLLAGLSGCASGVPESALRLPESTLEIRSIQTRTFTAASEISILTATIAVLQDMEFNIDRIEKPLGVITASRVSDADSASEKTGLIVLDFLCVLSGGSSCDATSTARDEQIITLTMVVLPSLSKENRRDDAYSVRITLQRVIQDKLDRVLVLETIDDPAVYQEIFGHLQKSIFIEETSS